MLLTYKHGRGNKIHLSIDGEYAITTTEKVWYECEYKNDSEISDEEWAKLCDHINFEKMYERALDLLELRDHSEREILEKLTQKFGYDKKEQAKYVCEKLSENGLLDDEHFARIYSDELIRRKHVSPAGLRAALSAKGISKQIADTVIEDANIDSIESINYLLDTKFAGKDLMNEKQCDKVITSLYRLGFMLCDIRDVIAERQHLRRLEILENS